MLEVARRWRKDASESPIQFLSALLVQGLTLMSYAVSYPALYFRAASYVDTILKGTRPGDVPVEQATKFELVVNLKAAQELGIQMPRSILLRADAVIE